MSVCDFPAKTRVVYKQNLNVRGYIYDWFDGDRDIPRSQNMYAICWDGISGQYWYYTNDILLEKDVAAKTDTGKEEFKVVE